MVIQLPFILGSATAAGLLMYKCLTNKNNRRGRGCTGGGSVEAQDYDVDSYYVPPTARPEQCHDSSEYSMAQQEEIDQLHNDEEVEEEECIDQEELIDGLVDNESVYSATQSPCPQYGQYLTPPAPHYLYNEGIPYNVAHDGGQAVGGLRCPSENYSENWELKYRCPFPIRQSPNQSQSPQEVQQAQKQSHSISSRQAQYMQGRLPPQQIWPLTPEELQCTDIQQRQKQESPGQAQKQAVSARQQQPCCPRSQQKIYPETPDFPYEQNQHQVRQRAQQQSCPQSQQQVYAQSQQLCPRPQQQPCPRPQQQPCPQLQQQSYPQLQQQLCPRPEQQPYPHPQRQPCPQSQRQRAQKQPCPQLQQHTNPQTALQSITETPLRGFPQARRQLIESFEEQSCPSPRQSSPTAGKRPQQASVHVRPISSQSRFLAEQLGRAKQESEQLNRVHARMQAQCEARAEELRQTASQANAPVTPQSKPDCKPKAPPQTALVKSKKQIPEIIVTPDPCDVAKELNHRAANDMERKRGSRVARRYHIDTVECLRAIRVTRRSNQRIVQKINNCIHLLYALEDYIHYVQRRAMGC